jgi:6-phosphogluconolactonase
MLSLVLIYVGSYTPDAGGDGKGISAWRVGDGRPARPAAPTVAVPSPSYLVAHPTAAMVYAVNELTDGSVTALAAGPGGDLEPVARESSGGAAPCHLALTPDARHLLCANYGSGSVAVFAVGPDGALGGRTDLVAHHGAGPDRKRQDGPHAHHVWAGGGGEVTAVDLGTDTLYGYRLGDDGRLRETWRTHAGPGVGPRHLVAAASGHRYVADELGSTVSVYEPAPDGLRLVQRLPATMTPPAGTNQPSGIALSADGRYVYVANRGNDSITTFAAHGAALTPVEEISTGGAWPRHFTIAGDVMYVANQHSDTVTVLRLDPRSGVPRPTGARIDVPTPACVLIRD